MPTGSKIKLERDVKENIRLSKIAQYFTELKQLRKLLEENKEHYAFLIEFKEVPIKHLEDLGIPREISETILIYDNALTPEIIEMFRETESRKFWE